MLIIVPVLFFFFFSAIPSPFERFEDYIQFQKQQQVAAGIHLKQYLLLDCVEE